MAMAFLRAMRAAPKMPTRNLASVIVKMGVVFKINPTEFVEPQAKKRVPK
jgi:hypothetical protein